MPYNLVRADGTTTHIIADGSVNTSLFSVGVSGRNTLSYGNPTAETVVRMLENFAQSLPPVQPIPGQLWYDKPNGRMRVNTAPTDGAPAITAWHYLVSADTTGVIGSASAAYSKIYTLNINDEAYVTSHMSGTLNIANVGTAARKVENGYFNFIGQAGAPTGLIHATAIGSSGTPTPEIYVAAPTQVGHAVNKAHFDTNALKVDGGTMISGFLTLANAPTNAMHATTKTYVDTTTVAVAGDTMTGPLTLWANPSSNLHAATKQYVDSFAAGIDSKLSCRAATTGPITRSGLITIDGVTLIAGDRVLVKDQGGAALEENGIFVAAAGAWARASDADNSPLGEVSIGMFTFITEGTVNKGTGWRLTSTPTNIDFDPLVFTLFSASTAYTGGDGITITGNSIDVDSTVIRTTGGQTISGSTTINNLFCPSGTVVALSTNDLSFSAGTPSISSTASTCEIYGNFNVNGNWTLAPGATLEATYADIAERYEADAIYDAGTVLKLGGSKEVTITSSEADADVFGVVSDKPAFVLNTMAGNDATHPKIAMIGRTPVKIVGPVMKGQRIVTSDIPGVARALTPSELISIPALAVIGRALEAKTSAGVDLVNCVVGCR